MGRNSESFVIPNIEQYDISSFAARSDNFEAVIDKKIEQLNKQKVDTSICTEYLENLVEEYVTSLLSELERKHLTNNRAICNFFVKIASERLEITKLIETIYQQIEVTNAEYKFTEKLYNDFNPLYNGKLNLDSEKVNYDGDDENE